MLQYRPAPVPDGHWSPRRINALVRELHLRSYLEIGVFEGETFVDVVTRRRYGVDPSPLFDAVYLQAIRQWPCLVVYSFRHIVSQATDRQWSLRSR